MKHTMTQTMYQIEEKEQEKTISKERNEGV
jgi:hypothetical protein